MRRFVRCGHSGGIQLFGPLPFFAFPIVWRSLRQSTDGMDSGLLCVGHWFGDSHDSKKANVRSLNR
eukprot:11781605-Alexandrium_andersonii.AAC.1